MTELTIHTDWNLPRDQAFAMGHMILAHPSAAMVLIHGRTPLWTRHMIGVREAERDRRKQNRY
jgi:hypothetical protein